MADIGDTSSDTARPRLGPRSKIVIPESFTKSGSNGRTASVAPASERTAEEKGLPPVPVAETAAVFAEVAPAPAPAPVDVVVSPKTESVSKPAFAPIGPGLSSVQLPLGPSPKNELVSGLVLCWVDMSCCGPIEFSVQFRGEIGQDDAVVSGLDEARRMPIIHPSSWVATLTLIADYLPGH